MIKTRELGKYDGSLQAFLIKQTCTQCIVDQNNEIVKVEFKSEFLDLFIQLDSDLTKVVENTQIQSELTQKAIDDFQSGFKKNY